MHIQSCPTLRNPTDCSPPGSSVHGIFQAKILKWVAISSSRWSSPPKDQTCVPCISCIDRRILLYHWVILCWRQLRNRGIEEFSALPLSAKKQGINFSLWKAASVQSSEPGRDKWYHWRQEINMEVGLHKQALPKSSFSAIGFLHIVTFPQYSTPRIPNPFSFAFSSKVKC